MNEHANDSQAIAIIGMAGRFPRANSVDALWDLLKSGRHAFIPLSDEALAAAGVDPALIGNPNYVKSCVKLDDFDRFDAGFFGYSPRQATSLDPQGRVFLECAWEALEHAGYDTSRYEGVIGIFAGCGTNTYLYTHLHEIIAANSGNWHQTTLDGEKDFLTMRTSYKLGLNGPSMSVQTACSSSLVAVHLACQSLLTFESDIVLAGGVSIKLNQDSGYVYEEGGIVSRDGYCRAYDADASGAVAGSGCGIVVLKRLDEALNDGDEIHAVIRATAVNNDGSDKVGFTAPGVKAQARLIASALSFAELTPRDIGMLEGHGTGTVLGDAVELAALGEAFGETGGVSRWCALGSIKTNIGHLDTAAGIAGLIKATLCLKHRHFVPSLHFARPNPTLDTADSPFFVNTSYRPWPEAAGRPRRAGVSAFGMGGTNAHAILEEPPQRVPHADAPTAQLFPLSAHGADALRQLCVRLAEHIEARPELDLVDIAYTLQVGRRRFAHRRVIVAATRQELIVALREPPRAEDTLHDQHTNLPVMFLFPGQGSQRSGAIKALYNTEPFFRTCVDECAALFQARLGFDIRPFICKSDVQDSALPLDDTLVTQPAVFTLSYSLARLWRHWGVRAAGLAGHSVGEYVAACVAGVFSLKDGVALLSRRAELVHDLPGGAMLAVRLSADAARSWLTGTLALASVNSGSQCVIAGPTEEIDALAEALDKAGIERHRLSVSHAFHSAMMEPAMGGLEAAARACGLASPSLPYVSCLSGQPAGSDVVDPAFWSRHLREPVNFQAAAAHLMADGPTILLEVGSGQALGTLARQQSPADAAHASVASLPGGGDTDRAMLLAQLGRLWCLGADIDWSVFHRGTPRRRVGLVAYPFQRQRYWIQAAPREQRSIPDALPLVAFADEEPDTSPTEDWNAIEAAIVELWRLALGVQSVRRADTFMALGGDSLTAARVITRLRDNYGVKIAPKVLISANGTIETLALAVMEQLADELYETPSHELNGAEE